MSTPPSSPPDHVVYLASSAGTPGTPRRTSNLIALEEFHDLASPPAPLAPLGRLCPVELIFGPCPRILRHGSGRALPEPAGGCYRVVINHFARASIVASSMRYATLAHSNGDPSVACGCRIIPVTACPAK